MIKKLLLVLLLVCTGQAVGQEANRTLVPDDNFEQALIDLGHDDVLDDYVLTTSIENIVSLELYDKNIGDLTGIENFLALEELNCMGNYMSTVDLSKNSKLKILRITAGVLKTIDLSANTELVTLSLGMQSLEEIDLTKNIKLAFLDLNFGRFTQIDLTKNVLLKSLELSDSNVSQLDISNQPNLQSLRVSYTELKELDISQNPMLQSLWVNGSKISTLDISKQIELKDLKAYDTPNLNCIQVKDALTANDQNNWQKDDEDVYSESCSATIEDADNDGVSDDLDICPNTPEGQFVNDQGCSQSQYADIAVQNVSIGLGSFLCSEPQNCTVDIAVLRDVAIDVSVVKNESETIFEGEVGISTPLYLENLTEGSYSVCATRSDIPGFIQCYDVSSTSAANSISTTIVMQNPGQVYTLTVEGNKKYEVLVNGNATFYDFDSVEKQNLEIPLVVGTNTIQIIGEIECNEVQSENIEEDESVDSLLLFPTLSNGAITLENTRKRQIHGITVTSLSGMTSKYIPVGGNPKEMHIDMQGAAKGMYIVRIQNATGKPIVKKILIR